MHYNTHSNIIKTMMGFTYDQIRKKALKQGFRDNIVQIALWADLNNYMRAERKKNGKEETVYLALQRFIY